MSIYAFNLSDKDAGHLGPHSRQDGADAVRDPIQPEPFLENLIASPLSEEEGTLAENLQAPIHPADEFAVFKDMLDDGLSVEDIALQYGLPQQRVVKRLKLAQVARRIFNAYRKGISFQ